MKKTTAAFLLTFIILFSGLSADCQSAWASWSHEIPIKAYRGDRFRMQVRVKAKIIDDSASARLWARVDKENGRSGFFENMWLHPVRTDQWNTYKIDGRIDEDASRLMIGALTEMNGQFFYDDFKVEVENNNKWETIYATDFEKDMSEWNAGIGGLAGTSGDNPLYHASVITDPTGKGKVLLIEAKGIVNYGSDKKSGNFADVNGIKLYYEIYGSGAPLVVLHGNGGSISSAQSHYPGLVKKYKVIAIDNRAQGKSTDTNDPLTYDQMASDINALLEQLHIDSAFYWGQSDGAILGLLMAINYPKKVKRVIAFAPNLQPDSSAVFGWAVTAVNRVIKTSTDKKEVKLYEMMRDYPHISLGQLHSIKAPVLIMGGDRDVIRPEHLVQMFQNIPNSQLCILPGSTHGGAWEKQALFMQILDDFFNKPFKMPDTAEWFKE